MNVYRAGDAIAFSATLKVNGSADPLTGVTVQACLVDQEGAQVAGTLITATVTNAAAATVTGTFTPAMTADLAAGPYGIAFVGAFAQGPMTYEPAPIAIKPRIFA